MVDLHRHEGVAHKGILGSLEEHRNTSRQVGEQHDKVLVEHGIRHGCNPRLGIGAVLSLQI